MRPTIPLLALALLGAPAAWAQQPAPAAPAESDQSVLMRGVLEALRVNTAALQRNAQVMETFSNRLERVEAATRGVPPAVEGLVATTASKRPAATLKFSPFACGNEGEGSCAVNACKSVGYANGTAVTVARSGTGAAVRPTSVAEATCFD
jgi:hypothetical protein